MGHKKWVPLDWELISSLDWRGLMTSDRSQILVSYNRPSNLSPIHFGAYVVSWLLRKWRLKIRDVLLGYGILYLYGVRLLPKTPPQDRRRI
jgi:hypothetical protein